MIKALRPEIHKNIIHPREALKRRSGDKDFSFEIDRAQHDLLKNTNIIALLIHPTQRDRGALEFVSSCIA